MELFIIMIHCMCPTNIFVCDIERKIFYFYFSVEFKIRIVVQMKVKLMCNRVMSTI